MDREAWRAAIHGVAKSWTRLSDWTELNWVFDINIATLSFWWLVRKNILAYIFCPFNLSLSLYLNFLNSIFIWVLCSFPCLFYNWNINCGKFWKRWEYQTTWPASWETYMQVRKQQLELDVEQWTGCKLGKEYIKAVYCLPAYLTYTLLQQIFPTQGLNLGLPHYRQMLYHLSHQGSHRVECYSFMLA